MKHRLFFVTGALCALASTAPMASAQVGASTKAPSLPKQSSVVIDAGHGGADSGTMYGKVEEKDVDLAVALLLRSELEKQGVQVTMTRTSDKFLPLQERVDIINKINPDCLISIHSYDAKNVPAGVFAYQVAYYRGTDVLLAEALNRSLKKGFNYQTRGEVSQLRYFIVRKSAVPSVLVDGNIASLSSTEAQRKFAISLAQGIKVYVDIKATMPKSAPILRDIPGIGKLFSGRRSPSALKPEDKTSPMQRKPESHYQYLGSKLNK